MINIIITLFIFVLLVTQKILLLNEESLILLCFITFVFIGITNLKVSINNSLESQSNKIKINLTSSLKKLINTFQKLSLLNKNFNSILIKFVELSKYYKNLIFLLKKLILNFNKCHLRLNYNNKINFLNKVEGQTIKLLTIVIIKKLSSIIKLRYFFNSSIRINQFTCIDTILLRECIQLINFQKN